MLVLADLQAIIWTAIAGIVAAGLATWGGSAVALRRFKVLGGAERDDLQASAQSKHTDTALKALNDALERLAQENKDLRARVSVLELRIAADVETIHDLQKLVYDRRRTPRDRS